MNPLVSICVPVYNVAPYIDGCVRSLMEQDYANIEYVFVNDGSTDDSVQRLEEELKNYPQRQEMVSVYHNDRNHGLAYTRRIAIEKATGEYIACVDSDDWIDRHYISSLIREAISKKADMVAAPFVEHAGNRAETHNANSEQTSIWCKLIKRELFICHRCFAPEGLDYGEDRIATLQLRHYAAATSCINDAYYHYVHQPNSITSTKTDYHFDCLIRYWQEAERLMREWGVWEQYAERFHKEQVEDKITLMLNCRSMAARKKYADLYRENELSSLRGLLPGFRLMGRLVHYRLWPLISIYQIYLDWLIDHKNK